MNIGNEETVAVCDKNCFACEYEDCVCDDLDLDEYREARKIELLSGAKEIKTSEKSRERQKRYREKNREKIAKAKRKRYAERREEMLAYRKKYYLEHREESLAYQKKYDEEHKEARSAYNKKRYAERKERLAKRE